MYKSLSKLFFIATLIFSLSFTSAVFAADGPELDENMEAAEYVTTDRVNFRKGPDTEAEKIETLAYMTVVLVTDYQPDGWSSVRYGDTDGYIKSEFLREKTETDGAVELTDWKDLKDILPLHVDLTIRDLRTGLTYNVRSFSNGSHADVEPSTKEDTEIMKKTYGGLWKWDPRPVYVSFGGRTIAASINGMPHGGGVIANNGMNGQICLHFLNSRTHNGNRSFERDHQAALMEAWNAVQKSE